MKAWKSAGEAEAWARVASTVAPLALRKPVAPPETKAAPAPPAPQPKKPKMVSPVKGSKAAPPPPPGPGLDSHWDRRIRAGALEPDFTLDLHGHTLDTAHTRLMDGLAQARAMDARVVLLIAGKSRPVEHADRGDRRGAIRAKVLDWLAASSHATAIAAIRKAHLRHGGEGALYVVLRRTR